jgi:hypothetical protein
MLRFEEANVGTEGNKLTDDMNMKVDNFQMSD